MVWCFGTLLFYTLMATKYVTYTYIALVPAAVLAAHAAPDVTSGKKIPGLLAIIPFLLLLAALLAGTFFFPDSQWWPLYIVTAYSVWALLFRWHKNSHRRLTAISTVTISALLVTVSAGLPAYMHTRSGYIMSDYLHKLPGQHYFFQSYSASFSYYTGETATRLIPILPSEDVQNIRDARWKEKYAMPSITEEEFLKLKKEEPVYLYVSKGNLSRMENWSLNNRFTVEKEFIDGTIFKLEK